LAWGASRQDATLSSSCSPGARAVQIGTANFIDPQVTVKAIDWMEDWCRRHGVTDINEIVGEI